MSNSSFAEYNKNLEDNMRKIILTGAVLAMLTSAAPMVHAQVDPGVQAKKDYDAKIQELEGKLGSFDKKIDNIGDSFNKYKDQNDKNVKGKIDENKLQDELTKQKVAINEDVQGKIEQAKKDLKADAETKFEAQRQILAPLNTIVIGADGKSGLQKDFGDLKKVVGENENEGLQKAVKENANNITQADKKAAQALTDIAELKAKGNDIAKDIAELGGRINVTGAMSAALAGLKPLQYDPMAPTQVMGSASTYEGQQAYALGLAHFTSENLMVHGGVSFTNSHKYMANVGVTYKFGHSAEKSMIPMRYQAGPISSIYVMQKENEMMREKMAQQEERIAQLEEMIMNMKK